MVKTSNVYKEIIRRKLFSSFSSEKDRDFKRNPDSNRSSLKSSELKLKTTLLAEEKGKKTISLKTEVDEIQREIDMMLKETGFLLKKPFFIIYFRGKKT
jgi:hypothetical protein